MSWRRVSVAGYPLITLLHFKTGNGSTELTVIPSLIYESHYGCNILRKKINKKSMYFYSGNISFNGGYNIKLILICYMS